MYAPQSSIDPALAALLQTAQMVTPEQTPTVAAQVAQAAQQKMQPQGIMQGMQGAKQDYAAAAPSMMENMKQQQMQQMVKQAMQPQPAGIEGLPAPNMQSMAEGGVVGYAGTDGSKVDSQVAQILQKAPAARSPEENDILRAAGVQLEQRQTGDKSGVMALDKYLSSPFIREAITGGAHKLSNEELRQRPDVGALTESIFRAFGGNQSDSTAQPQAMRPEDAFATPRMDQPQRSTTPPAPPMSPEAQALMRRQVSRGGPPATAPAPARVQPAAAAAPAAGIAQLVAPTMDRSRVDSAGKEFSTEAARQEAALRKIASDREAAIKGMPDLNEQGIASLRRAEAERRRLLGIDQSDDSRRRWAGIFRGWGGDRDAYDRILTGIASRDAAANQAQLASEQAELKLREAQQAKALGQFDRAKALELEVAELKNKARDDMLKARQIEASLASNEYSTKANIYGTDVSARERAADRAQQAMIEGARLKQQAELNGQTKLANQINAANITVSSAIEKMDRDLEKRFGQSNKLFQIMSPEDIQKNPGLAASYQQYQRERDNIYKTSVEPAINHRNRLAAMITSGQDLSKWGELQVNPGR